jgi:hypothetical protein
MACLLDINEEQINPQYLGRNFSLRKIKFEDFVLGQNQILIDRHGHTLSQQLLDKKHYSISEKQIDEYAQKLLLLGQ